MIEYSLNINDYTYKNALLWGNFRRHVSLGGKGRLGSRDVHLIIAAFEFLPIIGQIVSLFEMYLAHRLWEKPKQTIPFINKSVDKNIESIIFSYAVPKISSLESIRALQKYKVSHVSISYTYPEDGRFFPHLKSIAHLTHLKIDNEIDLTDTDFDYLRSLNLEKLEFTIHKKITDDVSLFKIRDLPIQKLNLCGASITDLGLSYLKGMRKLQHLVLSCCKNITNDGLVNLKDLPLRYLDICQNEQITDKGVEHVQDLSQLQSLNIGQTRITNTALSYLKDLLLEELDLQGTGITDQGLKSLEGMETLKKLILYDCRDITDKGLLCLRGNRELEYLSLNFCEKITDDGLKILKIFPLRVLEMYSCKITDEGLAHLSDLSLHELDLSSCEKITDEGVVHLGGMPLKRLRLGSTSITGLGLFYLRSCSELEELDLNHCLNLTDADLSHLESLPLRYFELLGCYKLTDLCFVHLKKMPFLKFLMLGARPLAFGFRFPGNKISDDAFENFCRENPAIDAR